ncbi:MAG: CRTAC1 family protein [Deltaproteobacteria bacterium]|nr:CRTAC1 family protein [Deltaproteobacteria bacterium]
MNSGRRLGALALVVASLGAPVLLGASCGDSVASKACVPGRTMACTCSDGSPGLQSCKADGSDYEACGFCKVKPPALPEAELTDVTEKAGLSGGAGPCVGFDDFDGDGDQDIVMSHLTSEQSGMVIASAKVVIHANLGDGTFAKEPTAKLLEGGAMICTTGDYDRDGRPDIVVQVGQPSEGEKRKLFYFRNEGNFTFTDVAEAFDVVPIDDHLLIAIGSYDYDNDGWLDFVIGRSHGGGPASSESCGMSENDFVCDGITSLGATGPLLYKNVGGSFELRPFVFEGPYPGTTNALAFADLDDNGLTDMFMANDWYTNHLHLQVEPGVYERGESVLGLNLFNHGMGAGINDFDLDGHPDIYVADLGPNSFFFGKPDGTFENLNRELGISAVTRYHSNWAVLPEDFNHDGLPDLFVASSGVVTTEEDLIKMAVAFSAPVNEKVPQFDLIFWNQGNRSFVPNILPHRGDQYPMVVLASSASADIDGDGDLDILVGAGEGLQLRLLRNEQSSGNYLMLDLVGTTSNPHGVGAVVDLMKGGVMLQRRYAGSAGSVGNPWKGVHFGLGKETEVETVRIRWPSGVVQTLTNVPGNQLLRVTEPAD